MISLRIMPYMVCCNSTRINALTRQHTSHYCRVPTSQSREPPRGFSASTSVSSSVILTTKYSIAFCLTAKVTVWTAAHPYLADPAFCGALPSRRKRGSVGRAVRVSLSGFSCNTPSTNFPSYPVSSIARRNDRIERERIRPRAAPGGRLRGRGRARGAPPRQGARSSSTHRSSDRLRLHISSRSGGETQDRPPSDAAPVPVLLAAAHRQKHPLLRRNYGHQEINPLDSI